MLTTRESALMRENSMAVNSTLTVSIGRALPNSTDVLSDALWADFKNYVAREIRSLVDCCGGQVVFTGSGLGTWTEDGVTVEEDSFTVIAVGWNGGYSLYAQDTDDSTLQYTLELILGQLAALYGQTAIACTVGTTTLVEARY